LDGLFFPGPALYMTGALVVRRPNLSIILGPGATLQHQNQTSPPQTEQVGPSMMLPPPRGYCLESAFLTISATVDVFVGGLGGTLDANGFDGNALCISDSSSVTMEHILVRGSASWSTHIFRSHHVIVQGLKVFSGADGFDPDNSQDVSLRSVFVHSNDDAVVVKATTPGRNTARVSLRWAVLSSKKSLLKVGTESLSDIEGVVFEDVEGFNIDRALVLYAYDGGRFEEIAWKRVRISSFYPYTDELKAGAVLDFETKNRTGLSPLQNISLEDIEVAQVVGTSYLHGVPGASIQGVKVSNLMLKIGKPIRETDPRSFLFQCTQKGRGSYVQPLNMSGLVIDWGAFRHLWGGLQSCECLRQRLPP